MPLLLMVVGVVIIIGSLVWSASLTGGQAIGQSEDNYPDIPRVSMPEAKAAYDAGTAIFVDVREAEAYRERHITGAVSMPITELPDRYTELDPQSWIITYCT